MKNKKSVFLFIMILLALIFAFLGGTRMGRYWYSVQLENIYPYELRDIWVANQPRCDAIDTWQMDKKTFLVATVTNKDSRKFLRIVSKPREGQENERVVSILDEDQHQFTENVFLECK